jgi:hypothetical protein
MPESKQRMRSGMYSLIYSMDPITELLAHLVSEWETKILQGEQSVSKPMKTRKQSGFTSLFPAGATIDPNGTRGTTIVVRRTRRPHCSPTRQPTFWQRAIPTLTPLRRPPLETLAVLKTITASTMTPPTYTIAAMETLPSVYTVNTTNPAVLNTLTFTLTSPLRREWHGWKRKVKRSQHEFSLTIHDGIELCGGSFRRPRDQNIG